MNATRRFIVACTAALVSITAGTGGLAAQRPVTPTDSLRLRVDSLMRQLDSLQAVIARIQPIAPVQADTADPLARIRAAAAAAAGVSTDTTAAEAAGPVEFVGRQRNLSALNPEISVTGDIFAFSRSDQSTRDNFVAREFEISFVSNLDPFSRAKVFVAHHEPGGEIEPFAAAPPEGPDAAVAADGHSAEVEIEEGYVEWVSLPGGLGLTLGKFRQRFGKLNRWHSHSLPGQQYPLPLLAFMGEEGLAQTGASVHWLAPVHGAGTWEVWGELTRSSSEALFGEDNGLSVLGHVNAFFEISPTTYVEFGVSGVTGGRETEPLPGGPIASGNRLFGADFTLDWRPPGMARYRQFTLHGAALVNRRTYQDAAGVQAVGGYVNADFKFAQQWIAGARYEYTENPDRPAENAWLLAPSLTWWQSEFVRIRAEYDVFRNSADRYGQFVLQATFAMGPHKHENY